MFAQTNNHRPPLRECVCREREREKAQLKISDLSFHKIQKMSQDYDASEPFNVKHWDTYKVLNKIKETIHNKRRLLKET